MDEAVLVAGRLLTGLLAGLYLAFVVGVMPGLARADDGTFVTAMKRINDVIVNPVFLFVFLGAPALSVALLFVDLSPLAFAVAALGVVTLVITFAANIPLNEALAAAPATGAVDAARRQFEQPWVRWHLVRTVTGVGCFACFLLV